MIPIKRSWLVLLLVSGFYFSQSFGANLALKGPKTDRCEFWELYQDLRVYKDPSLFISNMAMLYSDPRLGWDRLMEETPLLTTVSGEVYVRKLTDDPVPFKNFGLISKFYALSDPRLDPNQSPLIWPIQVCGGGAGGYKDTIGFVLVSDLTQARKMKGQENTLPPSVYPNPIPELPKN